MCRQLEVMTAYQAVGGRVIRDGQRAFIRTLHDRITGRGWGSNGEPIWLDAEICKRNKKGAMTLEWVIQRTYQVLPSVLLPLFSANR